MSQTTDYGLYMRTGLKGAFASSMPSETRTVFCDVALDVGIPLAKGAGGGRYVKIWDGVADGAIVGFTTNDQTQGSYRATTSDNQQYKDHVPVSMVVKGDIFLECKDIGLPLNLSRAYAEEGTGLITVSQTNAASAPNQPFGYFIVDRIYPNYANDKLVAVHIDEEISGTLNDTITYTAALPDTP